MDKNANDERKSLQSSKVARSISFLRLIVAHELRG